MPNREFGFIKTTFGDTIYIFDLISAFVLTFRPSHMISYEFDFVSYEFDLTSCDFVLTFYEYDSISYEFVLTSSEFGLTLHNFNVTSDNCALKMV